MLELKNLEHENITVILSFSYAKSEFTSLVNKPVEKTWYSKTFDVLFFKCSDWKKEGNQRNWIVLPQEHAVSISQKIFHSNLFVFRMKFFKIFSKILGSMLYDDYLEKGECCWELSVLVDTTLSPLEWYEMRIFGPKLITIFWLESLSSKYKTEPNAVLKNNVRIDLIRTLWMGWLLKLNWEFSWIHNTQSYEKTVQYNIQTALFFQKKRSNLFCKHKWKIWQSIDRARLWFFILEIFTY